MKEKSDSTMCRHALCQTRHLTILIKTSWMFAIRPSGSSYWTLGWDSFTFNPSAISCYCLFFTENFLKITISYKNSHFIDNPSLQKCHKLQAKSTNATEICECWNTAAEDVEVKFSSISYLHSDMAWFLAIVFCICKISAIKLTLNVSCSIWCNHELIWRRQ